MRGFLVSGPGTGVGKTTVSAGLMAALRKRGLRVQPFKCGPDFIDPGHHTPLCGRLSHNLDTWMLSADQNWQIFRSACHGADIAVVEGDPMKNTAVIEAMPLVFKKGVGYDSNAIFEAMKGQVGLY